MSIETIKPEREEVMKRVARFGDLREISTGLPDMNVDGYRRSFLSVLDFVKPDGSDHVSPTGSDVTAAILEPTVNYGVTFVKARPGNGVMKHNHDTNESFLILEGKWRIGWEGADGNDDVLLGRYDFITFQPGVYRDFECVEAGENGEHGLLLGIIMATLPDGTPATAEFSAEAKAKMAEFAALQDAVA